LSTSIPELAGIAGAAAGAAVGLSVTLVLPTGSGFYEAATGALAAVLAVAVFGVVGFALDREDLRGVVGRLRGYLRSTP
jgi:putative peptidoglycan lipid II flippase